jgi:hypothetical protein
VTRDELLDLFRRSGALLEGHFRLTSGLHSPGFLQCALVLQDPQHAEMLGRAIADLSFAEKRSDLLAFSASRNLAELRTRVGIAAKPSVHPPSREAEAPALQV